MRVDITNYKEKIAEALVTLHEKTKPGTHQQEDQSTEQEVKKAVDSVKSNKRIDGTKFKSQYPGDDLKRVLFVCCLN